MADSVPVSNVVCVDDMGKARVMEPVLADKVSSLKDQCTDFLNGIIIVIANIKLIHNKWDLIIVFNSDIELYRDAVDSFIGVMENLAKQVDQEKRDAIIVSNKLASLSSKTEEKIAMLQVSMWCK